MKNKLCSLMLSAAAASAILVLSCSSMHKGAMKPAPPQTFEPAAGSSDSSLQGTFTDNCAKSTLLKASEKLRISFQGSTYTQERVFYDDDTCSQVGAKIVYTGEFSASKSDPNAIAFNLNDAFIEATSAKMAKALSKVKFCGQDNFVVGKQVRVTGGTSKMLCPLQQVPGTFFGTYAVEENRLYFDKDAPTSMSQSKQSRVSKLNRDHYFTKETF